METIEQKLALARAELKRLENDVQSLMDEVQDNSAAIGDVEGWQRDFSVAERMTGMNGVRVSPNADGDALIYGADDESYPLDVILDPDYPSSRVAVRGGNWTACKRVQGSSPDYNISDVTTIMPLDVHGSFVFNRSGGGSQAPALTNIATLASDLGASQTYWVYARLETANDNGDAAQATRMNVYLSTTEPKEDTLNFQNDSIRILRKVTTDSDGVPTLGDVWTRGNIKTQPKTFDSSDPIHDQTSERYQSLGVDQFGRDQVHNFNLSSYGQVPFMLGGPLFGNARELEWWYATTTDGASTGTTQFVGDVADRVNDSGDIGINAYRYLDLRYGFLENGVGGAGYPGFLNIDPPDSVDQTVDIWEYVKAYVDAEQIAHGDLSDMPDDTAVNGDHDLRYWKRGKTYTEAFGQSIGYSTNPLAGEGVNPPAVEVIDLANKYLYDSNALLSANWDARVLYYSNGTSQAINYAAGQIYDVSFATSIDFVERRLQDSSSNITLQYNTRTLTQGQWTCDQYFNMTGTAYQADGVDGLSVAGHAKGILTDESELEEKIDTVATSTYLNLAAGGF